MKNEYHGLPKNINIMNPVVNKDAKNIKKLIKSGGKVSGYELSDGQILSKSDGVALAKQGGIRGVAIATRNGNESPHQTRYFDSERDDCFVTKMNTNKGRRNPAFLFYLKCGISCKIVISQHVERNFRE